MAKTSLNLTTGCVSLLLILNPRKDAPFTMTGLRRLTIKLNRQGRISRQSFDERNLTVAASSWSIYRARRLRQAAIMRSSSKTTTAIPVPLVTGMKIAKNGSYLLETFPSQYFSNNPSSVAPRESRNRTVAKRSNPAITALIAPRGATVGRLDTDGCPLSGTRVVIVISFCLFAR